MRQSYKELSASAATRLSNGSAKARPYSLLPNLFRTGNDAQTKNLRPGTTNSLNPTAVENCYKFVKTI